MPKLDLLLAHFENVKKAGKEFSCRCPAHEDRANSLSIVEKSPDHIYLHCFAGCDTLDVLNAVGLSWDAVFPDTPAKYKKPTIPIKEAATVLAFESAVVYQWANAIANNENPDRTRLIAAITKIEKINRLLGNY